MLLVTSIIEEPRSPTGYARASFDPIENRGDLKPSHRLPNFECPPGFKLVAHDDCGRICVAEIDSADMEILDKIEELLSIERFGTMLISKSLSRDEVDFAIAQAKTGSERMHTPEA